MGTDGGLFQTQFRASKWMRFLVVIGLSLALTLAVDRMTFAASPVHSDLARSTHVSQATASVAKLDFPLRPHALPPTLAQWQPPPPTNDYFDQIKAVNIGYLVWSHFPVTVYIQPLTRAEAAVPFSQKRSQIWINAVIQAVQDWNRYLPLTIVTEATGADISVWRLPPPLQLEATPSPADAPGQPTARSTLTIGRARSAVTRYELYAKGLDPKAVVQSHPVLAQRFTIQLRPDQAPDYLLAAARHELGHALGIWGHSRSQTDVMYYAQVRHPPAISARDVNTLKRIYEQPTRLGWTLTSTVNN